MTITLIDAEGQQSTIDAVSTTYMGCVAEAKLLLITGTFETWYPVEYYIQW